MSLNCVWQIKFFFLDGKLVPPQTHILAVIICVWSLLMNLCLFYCGEQKTDQMKDKDHSMCQNFNDEFQNTAVFYILQHDLVSLLSLFWEGVYTFSFFDTIEISIITLNLFYYVLFQCNKHWCRIHPNYLRSFSVLEMDILPAPKEPP